MLANERSIIAVTGKAHCQRQVAFFVFVGVYTAVAWWQTQDGEDVAVVGTKVHQLFL